MNLEGTIFQYLYVGVNGSVKERHTQTYSNNAVRLKTTGTAALLVSLGKSAFVTGGSSVTYRTVPYQQTLNFKNIVFLFRLRIMFSSYKIL